MTIVVSVLSSLLVALLVYYLSPWILGAFDKRKRYVNRILHQELTTRWDGADPPPKVRIVYKKPIRPILWGLLARYDIQIGGDDFDLAQKALETIRWDEVNRRIADMPGGSDWLLSHGELTPLDKVEPDTESQNLNDPTRVLIALVVHQTNCSRTTGNQAGNTPTAEQQHRVTDLGEDFAQRVPVLDDPAVDREDGVLSNPTKDDARQIRE